jgi:2-methylcitrate dehydratase PrpD
MAVGSDGARCAVTSTLSAYIAGSLSSDLPRGVIEKTKLHVLDIFAAMISGSRLKAGQVAVNYLLRAESTGKTTVVGNSLLASASEAALANGMMAHADETDDSHQRGRFHPGCAIVPAALAVAERDGNTGSDFLKAVALGYDVGARVNMARGLASPATTRHSTHSIGTNFGAAAAAAALLRLSPQQVRYVLSYATQQASGVPFWQRDLEHVEKAFDFGGMSARNGVAAATMVAAGFTAIDDPFSGKDNFFTAFAENPLPHLLVEQLGERFEILEASLKKWCVGSPIQAALDALNTLIAEHTLEANEVTRLVVTLPDDRFHIVNDRTMPDICVQHLLALMLVDGYLSFESCHDASRMSESRVMEVRKRIEAVPSAELSAAVPARQAIVEIETASGEKLHHHARAVRGTPDNPMTAVELEAKARELIAPVIGDHRAEQLIAKVRHLENIRNFSELRPLLQA